MNAPGGPSAGARPAASHILANTRSISLANHCGSVYAVAGNVVRAARGEVVLIADS
jgi:hypothetical protein